MSDCTTHHHACACREAEFAARITQLERDLAEAQAAGMVLADALSNTLAAMRMIRNGAPFKFSTTGDGLIADGERALSRAGGGNVVKAAQEESHEH